MVCELNAAAERTASPTGEAVLSAAIDLQNLGTKALSNQN